MAIPLTSGVTTTTQSAVTLAMGHLDDPANTFWELFLRPAGSSTWSLHTPPGVADNGGLVVAVPAAGPVTVGFLPSGLLRFSPVAQSDDAGKTWTPGVLPSALVPTPDALATIPSEKLGPPENSMVALATGSGGSVLTGLGDLSTWHTVATIRTLARSVSGCTVKRITAVAADPSASGPVLGVQCAESGRIGVLFPSAISSASPTGTTMWSSDGPLLTGGASGNVTVLRLESTDAGLTGLVGVRSGTAASLVAFWQRAPGAGWSQSTRLAVPSGWTVRATSTGGGGGQGVSVLLGVGSRLRIAEVAGPGSGWLTLPVPPAGTGDIVTEGAATDAFVVSGSRLGVWAWSTGDAGWHRTQTVTVPVPYGSSS
jgi:hypothetical protein